MLTIKLPAAIEHRLNVLAKATGRTKTYYAREAILAHMDALEDVYLSIERLQAPSHQWSLEEMEREIDLRNNNG